MVSYFPQYVKGKKEKSARRHERRGGFVRGRGIAIA